MKVTFLFFRQTCQFFLSIIKIINPVFFFVLLFCIAGCGEEEIEPYHYNPISPLPLRIDVTVTPTPDSISSRTQSLENQEESSDEEIGQNTPTPFPDIQSIETPTPVAEEDSESSNPPTQATLTPTLTPTPNLTSTPTSTPSPSPKKSKVLPTPTPIAETPEPTKTPKATKTASENSHKGEESNNPSRLQKADVKQADKQTAQKTEKFVPIVTPYNITIDKLAVCSKISNRNPVNCGDEFSLSKVNKVYTWVKVSGVKPPKVVKHVYYWKGALIATVKLKLKYPSMRTWSQKTFKPEQALGKWKVVITTEKDEVITVKEFTVVP
jgi:hypothetical protein